MRGYSVKMDCFHNDSWEINWFTWSGAGDGDEVSIPIDWVGNFKLRGVGQNVDTSEGGEFILKINPDVGTITEYTTIFYVEVSN